MTKISKLDKLNKINKSISDNKQFLDSEYLNSATYYDYLDRMEKICESMFEWVNLPASMDQRFLEESLFWFGQASFLKDPTYGIINTRCCTDGKLSIYNRAVKLHCYAINYETFRNVYTGFKNEVLNEDNQCVVVYNNWKAIPTCATIKLFAYRMYLAQRSCDVNVQATRTPILIIGTDKQQLTLRNLYNQYDGNQPFIFGDKDFISNDMLKAIDTKAPLVVKDLSDYKKEIWNEFLTFIGVNNIDVEKKERLISGESTSNNEVINLNLQSYLAPRKEACKKFNELFGLTGDKQIDVRLRSDLFNIIKQEESITTDYNNNGIDDKLESGDSNE